MKKLLVFCLATASGMSFTQLAPAQGSAEAAKLAREGNQAAKDQDWDKAIQLCRKAADLDHKFAPNLAIAYRQRGFAYVNQQRFQDALSDFSEAIRINPRDAGVYEQRAAVEMRINDYDKALADYSEAIKVKPDDVRFYLRRGYIYEIRGDIKNSMADTDKALKIEPKNQEAQERKKRLHDRLQSQMQQQPLQNATPITAPPAPPSPKKTP
jgi:tetratricopeptide (TPR) repeat protein